MSWSARSEENARRARKDLFGLQNSRKRSEGLYAGLLDPSLMTEKVRAEADFKAQLAGKPEYADALAAYDKIAAADQVLWTQFQNKRFIDVGFSCASFDLARTLLRAGDERPKPNGERLTEYSDAKRQSLELTLFSDQPLYPDFEILKLANSLTFLAGQVGVDDPLVQKILAGKSPRARAAEVVNGTQVRDVAFRKRLYAGGASAVAAANDPMIELARLVDPESRAERKVHDDQEEIIHQSYAAIARAKIALLGTAGFPDATFTLRLSFGTVKGYQEDGHAVPAFTTLAGLYERAGEMKNRPPFDLPATWEKRRSRLRLDTPFNFASTCDIIGGNSGSPVVNRAGEFVGIIFDGNLQGLPWNYAFNDEQGRAIAVESAAIVEALDKVYAAKPRCVNWWTGGEIDNECGARKLRCRAIGDPFGVLAAKRVAQNLIGWMAAIARFGDGQTCACARAKAVLKPPHSKRWREWRAPSCARSVLECGGPPPLSYAR